VAEHGEQENSDGSNAGAETVKLDAAALRKLVVSTVLNLDDDGEVAEQPAAAGAQPAGKPEPR
jgi:hypothetical protein